MSKLEVTIEFSTVIKSNEVEIWAVVADRKIFVGSWTVEDGYKDEIKQLQVSVQNLLSKGTLSMFAMRAWLSAQETAAVAP